MTVVIHNTDVGAPDLSGVAGSLIAVLDYCLVAGLGWTKPYSGTNKAVYQMPPGSSGRYLRVDDSIGASARLVGYESMSGIDTGSGPFPTVAQAASGLVHSKSTVGAGRPWAFFGSGAFFLFVSHDGGYNRMSAFGDPIRRSLTDAYATTLLADSITGFSGMVSATTVYNLSSAAITPHSLCRSLGGLGGAVPAQLNICFNTMESSPYAWAGTLTYPDLVTGGLTLSRLRLIDNAGAFRAYIPGLWVAPHTLGSLTANFASKDIITGQAGSPLAGKTFEVQPALSTSYGFMFLETSDTWYT